MPVLLIIAVVSGVLLVPTTALAWGPFTHLDLAQSLLARPEMLPAPLAQLLLMQLHHFYYGSIAADIVLAKNLSPYVAHAHNWENVFKLLQGADNASERAFAFGYLTHLAADTIAHNDYIPYKLIESFAGKFQRHSYWELRFDQRCFERVAGIAAQLRQSRFPAADALHERFIRPTLFNFRANRRIFSSVFVFQSLKRWRRAFDFIDLRSPWPLTDNEVAELRTASLNAMRELLWRLQDSAVVRVDPRGLQVLELAKAIRQELRRLLRKKVVRPEHAPWVVEHFRPLLREAATFGSWPWPEMTPLLARLRELDLSVQSPPPRKEPGRARELLQRALRLGRVRVPRP